MQSNLFDVLIIAVMWCCVKGSKSPNQDCEGPGSPHVAPRVSIHSVPCVTEWSALVRRCDGCRVVRPMNRSKRTKTNVCGCRDAHVLLSFHRNTSRIQKAFYAKSKLTWNCVHQIIQAIKTNLDHNRNGTQHDNTRRDRIYMLLSIDLFAYKPNEQMLFSTDCKYKRTYSLVVRTD